jgi:hypothetical protein
MNSQIYTVTISDETGRISTTVEARTYVEALAKLTLQLISQELDPEEEK